MKEIKNYLLIFLGLGSLIVAGCEESPADFEYKKEVVVSGTLTAERNVDTIKVHWTGEVDKYYSQKSLAITNAIVLIRNADGSTFDSLVYVDSGVGFYRSNASEKIIQPTKTYSLYIRTPAPDVREVTAITTVPDTFSIIYATMRNNDTVKYDVNAPIHQFIWTPSAFAATYLPTVSSLDQNAAMIPKTFYSDTTSKDFQRPEKIGYRIGLPKEQTNTVLPWVFLSYYGRTQFDIYSVDENYNDFLNQIFTAQGGELKEIRYKINGGVGLFGARTQAKNSIVIYLKP